MTEDEAKEKWCPFAKPENRKIGEWWCLGSGCAMWQQSENPGHGFCGLVQKPAFIARTSDV